MSGPWVQEKAFMNDMLKIVRYVLLLSLCVLGGAGMGTASCVKISQDTGGLDHALVDMLAQVQTSAPAVSIPDDVRPLVDAVRQGVIVDASNLPVQNKMTAASYFFSVRTSMTRFLQYAYNPDLPTYLIAPNTVRRGEWTEVNGKQQPLPKLWELLDGLAQPVEIRGVEHEEITPDISSGGYYTYDMDRALILLTYEDKPVFISVTRQQDTSDVGKKGAVLGPDSDWQYLYSGVDGLTKGGLGWVSSYMYGALSVTVFCETGTPDNPAIKVGVFKWLRAGWAGINMVRSHHIQDGCERFATAMKSVLENPNLPPLDQVVETIDQCEVLSTGELRALVKPYVDHLQNLDDPLVKKSPFKKLLRSGEYLKTMPREDMLKILVQGYLKKMMGRGAVVDTQGCQTMAQQRTAALR